MAISFNCPDCKVNIHTTMYDVLQMGFSCGLCGKEIVPDAIFRKGGLDRDKEMLAWIGEATVSYMDAYRRVMEKAEVDGLSQREIILNAGIWQELHQYSSEVQNRILHYRGISDE
jgi:hypothetical protein